MALALWPAALLGKGMALDAAAEALEEVLEVAEACRHPATRCATLARLCCDYFRLAGASQRDRAFAVAEEAEGLAAAHGLSHCTRSAPVRAQASPRPRILRPIFFAFAKAVPAGVHWPRWMSRRPY